MKLSFLLLAFAALTASAGTFEVGESDFLLNGKPFVMRCGEIHYARIPRAYWRHRLQMLRAMGCNTVGCYMFWNFHEREPGKFSWENRADAATFCRMAQEEGLWVVLRPGPYACAEWEGGGAPWWLMANDIGDATSPSRQTGISMRSSDPRWVEPCKRWIAAVGQQLAPLQITKGGPILMVQVENEYGLHGNDTGYIRTLRQATIDAGFEVPLYACNPPRVIQNGFIPELFQAANFGADPEQRFGIIREWQPKGPLMCSEYYPAWFDTWGQAHHPPKRDEEFFGPIDWMLEHRASFSLYMAHGGTSFGGWTGCRNPFVPNVTSYDYEAPINEHGAANPSFAKFRDRCAKYLNAGETITGMPAPIPVKAYGSVRLASVSREKTFAAETYASPVYFERLGFGFGLATWRTTVPPGVEGELRVTNLHDFGYVFLEGERVGALDRRHRGIRIRIPASDKPRKLEILVEAMGRINSSSGMEDRKGLDGKVWIGKTELKDWSVSIEKIDPDYDATPCANWRGTFSVDEPADTFVDMRGFNKGIVWVNGHNLGRYWKIGPQQTLYVPGCWLQKGENTIAVREMFAPWSEPTVAFLDHPILNELHLEADFSQVKREHTKFIGGAEVATGTFPSSGESQVVMFKEPVKGTFFTLQALSTYDKKNLGSISEFAFLDKDGNPLNALDLTVTGVDSEEEVREDGVAENAIDGQVEACWIASSRSLPHWIEFHTPKVAEVAGFRYTPRQNDGIGRIKDWSFFVRGAALPSGRISESSPWGEVTVNVPEFPEREFPIDRYAGDVNRAMEACAAAGGGRVVIPKGTWLSKGPVNFKSNCLLYLEEGAELTFSDDPQDYPKVQTSWEGSECMNYSPLIYAYECENIGIAGTGLIHPRRAAWNKWDKRSPAHQAMTETLYHWVSTNAPVRVRDVTAKEGNFRPHLVQFNRCRNILLKDYQIKDTPFWTEHLYLCKSVLMEGVRSYAHTHNSDGIDIEMTQDVIIRNCHFDQGDDGVVLKSGRNQDAWRLKTPTRNVVVRDCTLVEGHGLLVVGSEMAGGVENVYMHDCKAIGKNVFRMMYLKTNERRGGFLRNIRMERCTAENIRFGAFEIATDVLYQWAKYPTYEVSLTEIDNIEMVDCAVKNAERVYNISGDARRPIGRVTLKNVTVENVKKAPVATNIANLDIR